MFLSAALSAVLMFFGACIQIYGLYSSVRDRKNRKENTDDPWNGRTLEWSISSPPPIYNFAVIPTVDQIDPLWAQKQGHTPKPETHYEDIHLPRNTPIGLYIGILSLILGFSMTWHIFWLAIISFIGIVACLITRLSGVDKYDIITAKQVKEIEEEHLRRFEIV